LLALAKNNPLDYFINASRPANPPKKRGHLLPSFFVKTFLIMRKIIF